MGLKQLDWRERFVIYVVVSVFLTQVIALFDTVGRYSSYITLADYIMFFLIFTVPPYNIICIILLSIFAFIEIKYFK